jgi:hypothetical protein
MAVACKGPPCGIFNNIAMIFSAIKRNCYGIVSSCCVYWSTAVAVGLVLYKIFPPSFQVHAVSSSDIQVFSYMAGVSFGEHWQNIPGNIAGFILALYTFRSISSDRPDH